MNHWSVEEEKMKHEDPEAYAVWSIENAINYGLYKRSIKKAELLKYWDRLNLDTQKRKFLSMLLKK